jgi:AcrR family transcriptional regulator
VSPARSATKRLPALERRTLIEERATELFAERGYSGTTLDEIAEAAGVTKPILYRHFASKKDLYLALLAEHRAEMPRFFDKVPSEGPLRERFEAIVEGWIEYVVAHAGIWKMLFRDSTGDEEIQAYRKDVQDQARAIFVMFISAQTQAAIPEPEIEPLAELMRTAGSGIVLWYIDNPETPRDALVATIMRVFDGVVATTPQRAPAEI